MSEKLQTREQMLSGLENEALAAARLTDPAARIAEIEKEPRDDDAK